MREALNTMGALLLGRLTYLGSGKRLFREGGAMSTFRLIDATTTASGLVTVAYAT